MADSYVIINSNIITGYATISDSAIHIENGMIADIFKMKRFDSKQFGNDIEVLDAKGMTVTPGLFDSHIHGIGGFGTDDLSTDSILGMSAKLAEYGVTSFLPTIYPDKKESLFKAEEAICKAMGHEKGAKIMGINIEGPFLSPERPGALPVESLSPVDIDLFDEIIKHGNKKVICMTVAPELKHMHELALHAKKAGVTLLAGHTNATYENMVEGMQCGILHSTHFFNAMSRLHHRNPGAVGAIMINPDMCCEIIADGVHVHPELVKLVVRLKPADNIVLITDALKPTAQISEVLYANGVRVVLSEEGAFVSADDSDKLHGSALTLNKAILNMKKWGIEPSITIQMASENPARIYGFKDIGVMVPGNCADLCVFDENFDAQVVFINGKPVINKLK